MSARILFTTSKSLPVSEATLAQPESPIWPEGEAPGARNSSVSENIIDHSKVGAEFAERAITGVRTPTITAYLPEKPNGVALLVTPGGSYQRVELDKEGSDLAAVFNAQGYTLFVMTYRMPADGHAEGANAPLVDAQRALRTLRLNAEKWSIDPQRIGVLGFSSGGHVAASLATRYDERVYPATDVIDNVSARPDFLALMYPVITMQENIAHPGSRKALIGEHPAPEQIQQYSPEKCITESSPPTFLVHAVNDPAVLVDNSLVMFSALRAQHVPAEMHLFEQGGHGFGIRGAVGLPAASWPELLMNWIEALPASRVKGG